MFLCGLIILWIARAQSMHVNIIPSKLNTGYIYSCNCFFFFWKLNTFEEVLDYNKFSRLLYRG